MFYKITSPYFVAGIDFNAKISAPIIYYGLKMSHYRKKNWRIEEL